MAYNSTVILTGNTGDEAGIHKTKDDKTFATLNLATTDSYKTKDGVWQNRETLWHRVMIFKPALVLQVQNLPKGSRLKITGSLTYREFEVPGPDGKPYIKKEATITAGAIEKAPLVKKENEVEQNYAV